MSWIPSISHLKHRRFLALTVEKYLDLLRYARAPTFSEFVSSLLETAVEDYNEHWLPYYLLCTPCHLNYSLIAKTEHIKEDSRLGSGGNLVFFLFLLS